MRIRVEGQHNVADVVLYERERSTRSRVVGIGHPPRPEWTRHDIVRPDYRCTNRFNDVHEGERTGDRAGFPAALHSPAASDYDYLEVSAGGS